MKKIIEIFLTFVCIISLIGCGKKDSYKIPTSAGEGLEENAEKSEQWDLIPMVMVNGELYLHTGIESAVEARCGVMDGEIISEVDGTEKPTEDNQSNFGTGYGYQRGSQEGTIEIWSAVKSVDTVCDIICIEKEGEKLCQVTIQSTQKNLENRQSDIF